MADATRDQALRMYRTMRLIREFEDRVARCFADAEIPGFIHLSQGQEAVAAGVCAVLRDDDLVAATHRGHGHCLAKGADPARLLAEIFGRRTGYCRGKGGSMHLCDVSRGILGTNGVVGAALPIAVGTALASQARGSGQVTVAFFGDGAASTGAAHEAFNLASLWGLPVVFVCENNLYAEYTPQRVHRKDVRIAGLGAAYGMSAETIDGNDALEVFRHGGLAVERARAGAGPTLLEAMTYRLRGHHEGDPMTYRTKEEVETWRAKDPIPRLLAWLGARGFLSAAEDDRLTAEVAAEIDRATAFARQSAWPAPGELHEHVHA